MYYHYMLPVQGSDSEPFVNSLTSFGGKIIAMECLSIDEGQL